MKVNSIQFVSSHGITQNVQFVEKSLIQPLESALALIAATSAILPTITYVNIGLTCTLETYSSLRISAKDHLFLQQTINPLKAVTD